MVTVLINNNILPIYFLIAKLAMEYLCLNCTIVYHINYINNNHLSNDSSEGGIVLLND